MNQKLPPSDTDGPDGGSWVGLSGIEGTEHVIPGPSRPGYERGPRFLILSLPPLPPATRTIAPGVLAACQALSRGFSHFMSP